MPGVYLEVPDDVGVLQAGEGGHLSGDARVLTGHLSLQPNLLHRILPTIQAVDNGHRQAVSTPS